MTGAGRDLTIPGLIAGAVVMILAGLVLPDWVVNLLTISFARALAVVGLLVLWRTGLISFGHALYYGLGAYTVAILGKQFDLREIMVTVPMAVLVCTLLGFLLGFIIRRYREIFFAMLSLAFSMVLYGVLVKTEALGSTDGFNVPPPTFLGWESEHVETNKQVLFAVLIAISCGAAILVHRYLASTLGQLTQAIRDNEIRVEYLGFSAEHAIHVKYVISAALAGLGGAILAISLSQVDPDSMVNWTVSGELVFVTILSGPGHVAAPFIGSVIFELIRTYAYEWLPHAWQLIVGGTLLAIIFFLPDGVWSLIHRVSGRLTGRGAGAGS